MEHMMTGTTMSRGGRGTLFDRMAKRASTSAGRPVAFAAAAGVLVLWALSGPIFGSNDTWQLVINTSTTQCRESAR
jgi:low affinity Fe/Cu permease